MHADWGRSDCANCSHGFPLQASSGGSVGQLLSSRGSTFRIQYTHDGTKMVQFRLYIFAFRLVSDGIIYVSDGTYMSICL